MVRTLAVERYLHPALQAGKKQFSVSVRDVLQDLVAQGFPARNTPQVCTALRKESFLSDHGIEIESIEGPPSKMSTTVVYHYRVAGLSENPEAAKKQSEDFEANPGLEDSTARAIRLTKKLRGLLKDELAAYGGGEAFLKWIRSEDAGAA
jgi:hypothetical protein